MFTAGIIMLGAFSATGQVTALDILIFCILGFFTHIYGCVINEFCDMELDSTVAEIQHKPLVKGDITPREAKAYLLLTIMATFLITALFYPGQWVFVYLILSYIFGGFYSVKGKYTAYTYDFSLGIGFFFLVLFGAATVGQVTPLTYVIAFAIFMFEVFLQWGNAMKDVDTDRKYGVPSRAVAWGFSMSKRLTLGDPNVLYGLLIKVFIILSFAAPYLLTLYGVAGFNFVYYVGAIPLQFILVFIVVIPSQLYIVKTMLGKHTRKEFTKFISRDLLLTWLIYPLFLLDILGIWVAVLSVFPLFWFVATNKLLYGWWAPKM